MRHLRSVLLPATVAATLVLAVAGGTTTAAVGAATGPVTSPPIAEPVEVLDAAIDCGGGLASLAGSEVDPVLLVPGTATDPSVFAWNHVPALEAEGIPWCTVALAESALVDAQSSAERIVHAVRRMHEAAGRTVDVVGISQGGMLPRWSLRWFPDVVPMVDDLVALAPSNHGSIDATFVCSSPAGCAPAIWQQRPDSAFLTALNAGDEAIGGVDHTVVWSYTDEIVTPAVGPDASPPLRSGPGAVTNVAIQDVCPAMPAEHLSTVTTDPVAWALTLDALRHDGPADPSRLDVLSVCTSLLMPGVDPTTFVVDAASSYGAIVTALANGPMVTAEPPLRCYATGTCEAGATEPGQAPSAPEQAATAPPASQPAPRGPVLPVTGGNGRIGLAIGAVAVALALGALARRRP